MSAATDTLLLPCGARLSNRLAKAAMTEGLADSHHDATDHLATLYSRWSRGGAGLLLTGNIQVDRNHLERPGNVVIDAMTDWVKLAAYAKAGTCSGNHLWAQLNHPGRQSPRHINLAPIAPSAVALVGQDYYVPPRAMTEAEIGEVIGRFASAAVAAQECGFTGVQIHAAHGYLISQFLNPLANQRKDNWGGTLENRARLLRCVVKATRDVVGAQFPISVKLNSSDFQKGGFTPEDCTTVVQWLEQDGVDLLEISGGSYEQPAMMGLRLEGARSVDVKATTLEREAYFVDYAKRIRACSSIPLMVTGGFRSRSAIDEALGSGALDIVGIGRPYCADTRCVQKLLSGEMEMLPAFERTLQLNPAHLGPDASPVEIAEAGLWGVQGWFCTQIIRLGKGLDPDLSMGVYQAGLLYMENEALAARALVQRGTEKA